MTQPSLFPTPDIPTGTLPGSPAGTTAILFRDVYSRQAQIQEFGQTQGHRPFTKEDLDEAILDELGEVTKERKPNWCWWKPGKPVDTQALLGELADVLHFLLIRDLVFKFSFNPQSWPSWMREPVDAAQEDPYTADLTWQEIALEIQTVSHYTARHFVRSLPGFLSQYNLTIQDLIRAYFDKTEENVRRWKALKESM